MSFINVASITIMFLVSSGWISRFKPKDPKYPRNVPDVPTVLCIHVVWFFNYETN